MRTPRDARDRVGLWVREHRRGLRGKRRLLAGSHGVSERTLRRWAQRADLPRRRPGRPRHPEEVRAATRSSVREALDRLGWTAGEPALRASLPGAPRRPMREALRALKTQRRAERRSREAEARVSVDVVGRDVLWCLDATHLGRGLRGKLEGQVLREAATRRTLHVTAGGPSREDDVIRILQGMRDRGRLPLVLATDNGPAYTGEQLRMWMEANRVVHLRSVPRTPQHNARAERAIGELKAEGGLGSGAEWVDAAHALRHLEHARARLDECRARACLGGLTAAGVDGTMPAAYTPAERAAFHEEARRAVEVAVGGLDGACARRRAAREAVFRVLERRGLIRRTRGGSLFPPPNPDTITC